MKKNLKNKYEIRKKIDLLSYLNKIFNLQNLKNNNT